MTTAWTLDASDGELLIRTGVTGRAARMGHRLTIAMTRWRATVSWAGDEPAGAELTVDVDSFEVLRGEGGVKSLSGPEKAIVKSNAMRSLDSGRYPEIRFVADTVTPTGDGYRLDGTLHIKGKSRSHVIDLRTEDLGDSWRLSVESTVRQRDYGVKPYSLLMGSVQVTDEVSVSFSAVHAKD
ncbi:YceI-like domain protein [Mycobacterium bohemicum DSM 44277]|uniref:S-adenosyl-L-methionine-dependent methyltransferase n=2 Tax=Mycobacterium bohemicum TaxID=56425 RepID=A0A1X1R1W9_MYCBE|nr:YceI family protein [Mycobacterium bohemicum]MCV6968058.1 YceI family protein [Mycobacterium bohemicum]ORU98064.1 S-adenosyl-L-methionine-dependent methyltransferase [Mycobacterium bohemicum]CPR05973.1 YceI-like domain protein [Mycobacterium bohemicum DSM 44277]